MRARMLAWLVAALGLAVAAPAGAVAATGYVVNACGCSGTVSVIDSATRSVVATVTVGDGVSGVAVAADGRAAYTANADDGTISVIDGFGHTVTRTIALGPNDAPTADAVSPDGRTLYVLTVDVSTGDADIAIVDIAGGTVSARIPLPNPLFGPSPVLAISPGGTDLYTVDFFGEAWHVDLTKPPASAVTDITPPAASGPTSVAIAPSGAVYLSDVDNQLFVLTPAGAVTSTIPLLDAGSPPIAVALDASGAHAWLAGTPAQEATVVDTATGTAQPTTGVGDDTLAVAVSPDDDGVFLVSALVDDVIVVDPSTRAAVATIPVGEGPSAIAFGPTPLPPLPPLPPLIAAPVVTAVSPDVGPTTGGHEVTIAGANFGSARQVLFGDVAAPAMRVEGFNTIVATVPPGAPGTVSVRVVGPDRQRSNADHGYHYVAPAPPEPTPAPQPIEPARCVVPDVRGLRLGQARTRLKQANCTVGYTSRIRRIPLRRQVVVRQALKPQTTRPHGWGVALALRPVRPT